MKKLINLGGCFSFMIFENTKNREFKRRCHNFFSSFNVCEVFQQHYFLKISIKENFIYFFRGRYLERKGGGKEKKNSKKCKEIILHPSEFFTMEIKVQFWIRYQ